MAETLIDTNVLVYAFTNDPKSRRAGDVLETGGAISVQALNEFAQVARRKLRRPWLEIEQALDVVRAACPVVHPVDAAAHEAGLRIAERYRLGMLDAVMIAVGLRANCTRLLSEDMQHDLLIDGRLRIENPFLGPDA